MRFQSERVWKMSALKRLLAAALLLAIALCLTACRESEESRYGRADRLLDEGKYAEAAKLFGELGAYGDAEKSARNAKAAAAAESGDYATAISALKSLGNFRDCPMMIAYWTARQYEARATDVDWSPRVMAAEAYDTVALFLDSRERAENCRRTVYDEAVRLAGTGQYAESMEMLAALHDYEDSETLLKYYGAFSLEQNNEFAEASRAFSALGDYQDSKEQAAEVLKRGYQKADAQERAGNMEAAHRLFSSLGDYEDAFERANKPYYDLGMKLREEKDWVAAVEAFERAGTYRDAEIQVKETKYMQAEYKREQQNWDEAAAIFAELGDYRDSTTVQINETTWQKALALEASGDLDAANELFRSLGRYRNAYLRVTE